MDGTQKFSPDPGVDFIPATCSPPYPIGLHGEGVAFKRAANALHRARIDLEHDLRHPLLQGSGPDANLESGGSVLERGGEHDQQAYPAGRDGSDWTRLRHGQRRFGTSVSDPTDQDHRSILGRRHCGYCRATDRTTAFCPAWATGGNRQSAGRRHHYRLESDRNFGTRRLYAAARQHGVADDQSNPVQEHRIFPGSETSSR